MKMKLHLLFWIISFVFLASFSTKAQKSENTYYTFTKSSNGGTGKWYMGREIAQVMGYQGISWLERNNREKEERTSLLLSNMEINHNDVIADVGAGVGYHSFKMAKKASKGRVYAIDIQNEMLAAMDKRMQSKGISNMTLIKCTDKRIPLPVSSLDKVLMVDVYHELNFPREIMLTLKNALKPKGKIYLVEYRKEDPEVPIKELHKMSKRQAVKEMEIIGFTLAQDINNLPWQHCMVFVKKVRSPSSINCIFPVDHYTH